ncbi:hypothetical protein RJT34_18429 [Clitoria ternatea]|uniref:Anthocyanin acyltransferase n=1 Tax=Clitoria ternatea TaxID=43366 RepID=A0AAN9PE07_CLITE
MAVKVIEQCEIGPPPGSLPSTSIPLTFFDLPWLYCPPLKRIFLYDFPYSTQHFLQTVLPPLKRSLSLTLQHFFPFSANLLFPPKPNIPHILFSPDDSLPFTVAESTANFTNLVSQSPRDVTDLHSLVPVFPSPITLKDGTFLVPLMAIQVTVFSNSGFTICVTFRHVAADGRAFHHFMKFWSTLCNKSTFGDLALPFHNRDFIDDTEGLKQVFLREFHDHVEKLKKWVFVKCKGHGLGLETLHITTFVLTCSLIWVCKVRSEETKVGTLVSNNDESYILAFMADCRNRPEFSIPLEYFGNCLVCGNAEVKRSKLVGENGILEAAIAIGSKVRELQCETFKGAETLMSNFTEFATLGQHMTIIAGSTKLEVYETDFGWGKPKRSEVVHLDYSGSLSLSDCRDKQGRIEVGLALERIQMNKFITILEDQLTEIAVLD